MKTRLPELVAPYRPERVVNCSYELSLGAQVFVTGEDKTKRDITAGTQIMIPPGQFANLLTEEEVEVPDNALGLISMKFTLKQPGLINVSGFHVDPGYKGKLLFSVYNAGPQAVLITSGQPAFLLWYSSLDGATEDTYQKSSRVAITDSDVKSLGGDMFSPPELANRIQRLEGELKNHRYIVGLLVAGLIGAAFTVVFTDNRGDEKPAGAASVAPVPATPGDPLIQPFKRGDRPTTMP